MTTREHRKDRFVKCPKCTRILQEPEHIPLYMCGGCATTLQAKYYKPDKQAAVLTSLPKEVQNHGNRRSFEEGNCSDLSEKSSSSGEQSTTQNEDRDEKTVENCDSEQNGAEDSAHLASLSASSVVKTKVDGLALGLDRDSGERLDQTTCKFSSEDQDLAQEQGQISVAASYATRSSSTMDHTVVGKNEAREISMEVDGIEKRIGQDELRDGVADENPDHKQIGVVACISQPQDESGQQELCNGTAFDKRKEVTLENSATEASMLIKSCPTGTDVQSMPGNLADGSSSDHEIEKMNAIELSSGDVSRNQINCLDADKQVVVADLLKENGNEKEQNRFVERITENLESLSLSSMDQNPLRYAEGLGARGSYGAASSSSSATDLKGVCEGSPSSVFQDNECEMNSLQSNRQFSRRKVDNFDGAAVCESELGRTSDSPEKLELVDTQEESGLSHKEIRHFPIKRSLASDGSISSCDGNDDQIPGQTLQAHTKSSLGNDGVTGNFKANSERNNVPTRTTYYKVAGTTSHVKVPSSMLSDELLNCSVVEEKELVRENGFPESDRVRLSKIGFPARVPFYKRNSEVTFETGSTSSYVQDDPPSHWTHEYPYRYEDQEPWQRTTHTHREYMYRSRIPEAGWRKDNFPPNHQHYHDEISGDMYRRPRYDGYSDRRRRAESWSLSSNLPRTQYSGDIFNGQQYQSHDPYMRPHPDGRRWSVQLPPPAAYYRQGPMPYMAPSRETSWDTYESYPTSPPRYMDPSYAWGQEALLLSDDQRSKDQILQMLQLRKQRQVVKRHIRPKAGGAPFSTCYICCKILQLPEDFLVSKRRKHRLKCGACLNILEFSLDNESCLAPSVPHTGETTATNPDRNVGSASSLSNVNHSNGRTSLVSGEAHTNGRDISGHNSFGALGREKSQSASKNSRNAEGIDESCDAVPSSAQSKQVKVTWQASTRRKSPLHRLMGYPSPEDLLAAHIADDAESLQSN